MLKMCTGVDQPYITFISNCCILITVDHSLFPRLAFNFSHVLHLYDDLLSGVLGGHLLLADVLGAGGDVDGGLVRGQSQSVN